MQYNNPQLVYYQKRNRKKAIMLNPTTLALLGGNEFTENCVITDKKILETVGKDNPIIRILPTANEHHPDIAAQNGITYFKSLGHQANKLMITNFNEANNQANLGQLSDCDLLYLPGGNPQYLLQSLLNSKILMSRLRRIACNRWLPPIERPSPSPVTTHTERSGRDTFSPVANAGARP